MFLSYYAVGLNPGYNALVPLYMQSQPDKHLAASVDAVSLAFLYFQHYSTQALTLSKRKYYTAIQILNEALKSDETVNRNSTLLSVLLLDLYEKFTNAKPRSSRSWMSHINGAIALVQSRGKEKLEDPIGLQLTERLNVNLQISCIAANMRFSPALLKLRSDLSQFVDTRCPQWLIADLTASYTDLRSAIQNGEVSGSDGLQLALQLDDRFRAFADSVPISWRPQRIHVDSISVRFLEQHFDKYPGFRVSQFWNVLRTFRILLNNTIRTFSRQMLDEASMTTSDTATSEIDGLVSNICASAPQFTSPELFSPARKMHDATEKDQYQKLIFPLYIAGYYSSPASRAKPWVINQLDVIASNIGIKNASVCAKILREGSVVKLWSIYALQGSHAFSDEVLQGSHTVGQPCDCWLQYEQ